MMQVTLQVLDLNRPWQVISSCRAAAKWSLILPQDHALCSKVCSTTQLALALPREKVED